jgi:hypothetical protein
MGLAALAFRIIAVLACLVCARAFARSPCAARVDAAAFQQAEQHDQDPTSPLADASSNGSDLADPDDDSDDDSDDAWDGETDTMTSLLAVSGSGRRESVRIDRDGASRRPTSVDRAVEPPPPRRL